MADTHLDIDDDETAYQALAEGVEDSRWAFGTGFTDALEGIDATVPSGIDGNALAAYCLMLGDDALVYSHRLQEWVTRAPELEEETALANIALDLLGQARMLLARAGRADGSGHDEDWYAFRRDEAAFRNVRLVERLDEDFGQLVTRLLVFSTWRLALFDGLSASADPVVAAIAAKGAKELAYHQEYAAAWVIRLGDGTPLSHDRVQAGLDVLWPTVPELFTPHPTEQSLPLVAVDPAALEGPVLTAVEQVVERATLHRPEVGPLGLVAGRSGRDGVHTEAMGRLLAELQSVARADPDATW